MAARTAVLEVQLCAATCLRISGPSIVDRPQTTFVARTTQVDPVRLTEPSAAA
jgi:hypothetical protein